MLQGNKKAAWSCQAAYNLDRIGVMNRLGSIQHHSATNERGNVQILAVIDGSGDFWLYNAAVGPTLVVRQDGKVGIGTTTPQAKLEVAGNVRATAFLGDSSGFDRDQRRQSLFARGIRTIVRHHSGPGNGLDQTWHLSRRQPGSPADEVDGTRERQEVVIIYGGFWMGHHEVTQGEYETIVHSNPSHSTGDLNRPVETVSWDEANAYCVSLTTRERTDGRIPAGWGYRLPTEFEWEYACRAWTTTRFGYGDDVGYGSLANYAWYSVNSKQSTHPVGQKLPNPWGLVDMHGNVLEWCSAANRSIHGGGLYTGARYCRSAFRDFALSQDFRLDDLEFRVVLASGQ